jgi:Uma2 family endonuclease
MQPARTRATFADLAALPESVRAEVLDGNVVEKAAPGAEHGRTQRSVSRFVGGPFDDDDGRGGPGGWWILSEVDVELGSHDVVRPDLAGWRRERLPHPGAERPIRVVPDWICEVLSPSNQSGDRVLKADLCARSGVAFYWMADAAEHVLEALRLESGRWVRLGAWDSSHTVRIPPFEQVELEVGRLFLPA